MLCCCAITEIIYDTDEGEAISNDSGANKENRS